MTGCTLHAVKQAGIQTGTPTKASRKSADRLMRAKGLLPYIAPSSNEGLVRNDNHTSS